MRLSTRLLILSLSLLLLISSCGKGTSSQNEKDSATDTALSSPPTDIFHADNDIAMTLKSVLDALNQGEQLDSIDYSYEGILTDGTGHILYTDIEGAPGIWNIEVQSPESLVIKNLYLGDLLPDALQNYIVQSLGLDGDSLIEESTPTTIDSENRVAYKVDRAYLIFQTQTALTPAGQEGPLMSISVTSADPSQQNSL